MAGIDKAAEVKCDVSCDECILSEGVSHPLGAPNCFLMSLFL